MSSGGPPFVFEPDSLEDYLGTPLDERVKWEPRDARNTGKMYFSCYISLHDGIMFDTVLVHSMPGFGVGAIVNLVESTPGVKVLYLVPLPDFSTPIPKEN